MKSFIPPGRSLICALAATAGLSAAVPKSDILPPLRRQIVVDTAEQLAHRKVPTPLPADLPSPFNPVDFDKPDPSDGSVAGGPPRPGAPAAANPARPGAAPGPVAGRAGGTLAAPATPPAPAGDRATLETLAAQITPSGTFEVGGKRQLIIKSSRFEVGTRFTATYNNQDYELELVAIDRTTFTLRYRGEEITRPIKPVR